MRCCKASTARIFTLFTLVVLLSHSFGSVHAQSSSGQAVSLPGVTSTPDTPTPSSTSAASVTSPASSASSAAASSPSAASQSAASSQSTPVPGGSSSQSSSASVPSSSSSSSASSSSASSTSSSSASSSSQSSSAISKSSTITAAQPSATGGSGGHSSYAPVSGQFSVPQPSVSSTDAPAATGAASNAPKSFLENKGAMAGVFGVAGVIAALIIIFIVMKVMQRRARQRDEEEGEYFEKYEEPSNAMHAGNSNNDSSWNLASAPAMAPARNDAYLDRTVHYGSAQATQDYSASRQHEYPPGTAYAAAAGGSQYQYTGYNNAPYGGAPSPTGSHPFADPQNVPRARAPPVSQTQRPPTQVGDAYGGIDDGYAQ
ncbi:hypothetical protein PsYK624_003330 [Phanerochaete sordida]|uniref:Uncharacterized protein n=1 Tax=Phanerochaete sordida TaxID=48140 RepID=A0A9P3FXD7_9APHY|nr:hypothetical protein PsYK624_003330 [Phanerochaete sordida]